MKRLRLTLLAIFVSLSATACDPTGGTGYVRCNADRGPTMGSDC